MLFLKSLSGEEVMLPMDPSSFLPKRKMRTVLSYERLETVTRQKNVLRNRQKTEKMGI